MYQCVQEADICIFGFKQAMSNFVDLCIIKVIPVAVRRRKILRESNNNHCLAYAVSLSSMLLVLVLVTCFMLIYRYMVLKHTSYIKSKSQLSHYIHSMNFLLN